MPAPVTVTSQAIGHHLFSRQADAAHPAGLDAGLPCPVPDWLRLVSYGVPARKSPSGRSGRGVASVDVHRRGGGLEWRVLSPGSPPRQPFIRPVAELRCASVIWPVGRHVQPRLPPARGHLTLTPCVCPPPCAPTPSTGTHSPVPVSQSFTVLRLHYDQINLR